jgi:lysophospholipase L1-like esterase
MIGTNDCTKISAQTMADDLAKLIDHVIQVAPDALLAVAKLPPLAAGQATINDYNGRIPALVKARSDTGKHIIVVDQSTLTSADLGDGVHPNAGGYVKMGDTWYEAIKTYLH